MSDFTHAGLIALFSGALFAQTAPPQPRFDIADVHAAAGIRNEAMRSLPLRNGRYEIRNATMLDLIHLAWKFDADKILGGPNWLELDRFDLIAKTQPDASAETQRLMLQSLLKERFKLALHEDTKPAPTWALKAGVKPRMKQADGSGETGCVSHLNGLTLEFICRNMTMASFAAGLRTMAGTQLTGPALDQTEIGGAWNFEVRWSAPVPVSDDDSISAAGAIDKQLGLKLEEVPVLKPVLVVDRVERKPSPNPPGVDEALPALVVPTRFEVAEVKPVSPGAPLPRRAGFQMQPGGRFVAEAVSMRLSRGPEHRSRNNRPDASLTTGRTVRPSLAH